MAPASATGTILDQHRLGISTGAVFWLLTPDQQEAELTDLESMGARSIRTKLWWRAVEPVDVAMQVGDDAELHAGTSCVRIASSRRRFSASSSNLCPTIR